MFMRPEGRVTRYSAASRLRVSGVSLPHVATGSTFIELTPFCDATCLAGCYSAYTTAGARADRFGIFRALQMPRAAACRWDRPAMNGGCSTRWA